MQSNFLQQWNWWNRTIVSISLLFNWCNTYIRKLAKLSFWFPASSQYPLTSTKNVISLSNYTFHEIAWISPYKQQATIFVIAHCPGFPWWGELPMSFMSPHLYLLQQEFFNIFFNFFMANANLTSTPSLTRQTLLSYWIIKLITIEITKVGSVNNNNSTFSL